MAPATPAMPLSPLDQQHTADPFPSNDDGPAASTLLPVSLFDIRCPPGMSPIIMPSSSNNDAVTAPWVDLPPELCNRIYDRVDDPIGIIRFPAVCRRWAAASKNYNQRPRLPSGAPTLLTSSLDPEGYQVEHDLEPGAFGLHNVATGKSFYGEAEGLKKRTWVGGKDDWLVTTDLSCNIELLNPITGARVQLPSFETIPCVEVVEVSQRGPGVSFVEESLHHSQTVTPPSWFRSPAHRLQKVKLCRKPTHPDGYLAVALFGVRTDSSSLVAFTAANDEWWTLLKNPEGLYSPNKYTDVTVHKGKVLAVAGTGDICSWDMDDGTASEPTILSPPDIGIDIGYYTRCAFYLVTSSGGDLQLVCLLGNFDENCKEDRWWRIAFDFQWSFWPRRVLLHELDAVTGAWRRVENLGGGRALFVGANYPFYADVPRNGSSDSLLREDCVYVADLIDYDAGIFDLKMGDDFQFNWDAQIYYPAISEPLQMPMWFRPTAHECA